MTMLNVILHLLQSLKDLNGRCVDICATLHCSEAFTVTPGMLANSKCI